MTAPPLLDNNSYFSEWAMHTTFWLVQASEAEGQTSSSTERTNRWPMALLSVSQRSHPSDNVHMRGKGCSTPTDNQDVTWLVRERNSVGGGVGGLGGDYTRAPHRAGRYTPGQW